MIINEFISLSFSFMTLVIRDKHQNMVEKGTNKYLLDVEQFNFNINKRSFLNCDNFVAFNHVQLGQSLAFIKNKFPHLMELVDYYYINEKGDKITPLHLAINNNRSVNILLEYMGHVGGKGVGNFSDILPDLVEKKMFSKYFRELMF